jgi:SAM-dependent methyltransferase
MSGWQLSGNAPSTYIQFAAPVMGPWTDDLILRAGCKDGDRVLDLACGTGFVANRVNGVSGATCKVTGLDVNEGMLNAAREIHGIDWHLGSATEMPFADGSFEVVLCQQGLQYFPDRPAAMREIARVLTPGGRVSLNVWGEISRQAFFSAFAEACGVFMGDEAERSFDVPFSLHTSEALHALAEGAGLKDAQVRFEHRTIRFPNVAQFAIGFVQASPVAAKFLVLPAEQKEAFGAHIADDLKGYIDDGGMAVPQENHFLLACR